jgi:hypothetical protein
MLCCPFCNWYLRKINRDVGLYECSNPECNSIIQKFPTHNANPVRTPREPSGNLGAFSNMELVSRRPMAKKTLILGLPGWFSPNQRKADGAGYHPFGFFS